MEIKPAAEKSVVYGPLFSRIGARLLDNSILFLAFLCLYELSKGIFGQPEFGTVIFMPLCLSFLYNTLFVISRYQATPGKITFGLKIVTDDFKKLTFIKAAARYFFDFIHFLFSGILYLIIVVHPRYKGLHDMLSGTCVIKKAPISR